MKRLQPVPPRLCLLAMVLGSSLLVAGCGPRGSSEAPAIDVARPAKIVTVGVPGSTARIYPGRVQAAQRVPLAFRVGGPVVEVRVSKGQRVAAGQVLARIDRRDYEVQVKNLEAQLAAARAQQLQANEEYQRVRGLYEHDNVSRSDFDRARAALDVSQAQVEANEQALKAARLSLADTELRAPYAGTVADRLVEAHQTLVAGQPVLRLQDVRDMEVLIDVPEREVAGLTAEEPKEIRVRFDAVSRGEEFPARVKEFATETDPQTQTFPVTLTLERSPSADLLPGMTASASWVTETGGGDRQELVVPLASVVTDESGAAHVWRVDPQTRRIERIAVTTGALTDTGLEILSGLAPADQILAAGVHFVTEGQKVRPIDPSEKG